MITLPLRSERVPLMRVLVAEHFSNVLTGTASAGSGPWVIQPSQTDSKAGLELLDHMTRPALPEVGECKLRMRFGIIDGAMVGTNASGEWDPTTDRLTVLDLLGKEIRVQLAPDTGSTPTAWKTVWWGRCEYQTDNEWPGATMPAGERIYTCLDGLNRTKRWFMTRHGAYINGSHYELAPGHPGYNTGYAGKTIGNRTSVIWIGNGVPKDSDLKNFKHTWQGNIDSLVWSDLQVVESALRCTRPEGEPQFSLSGSTTLLSVAASPWPVQENDTAWSVINRVLARERGRGLAYLDWDDDSAAPTGPLSVKISIGSQSASDITYITNPTTGATSTISGATTAGTTVAVDLIGDHRAMPEGFARSNRGLSSYSAVETVGEKIQVLVTASMFDDQNLSLSSRWATADETAFKALEFLDRLDEKWRTVYTTYGLPRSWQGFAKDHNNGATIGLHRVDYRCGSLGNIIAPLTGDPIDTSPLLVKALHDTPLLQGYTYPSTISPPVRRGLDDETGEPDRLPPQVWIRTAANRYIGSEEAHLNIQIKNDGILIWLPKDFSDGTRTISDISTPTIADSLGATYSTSQLGITLALELPHRLRFYTLNPNNPSGLNLYGTKRIEIPDAHLWLASPGAIWDVDGTTRDDDGSTASRATCGATIFMPGILRDDRARVAAVHALACSWYMVDHLPCSWTMRCCGLLPTFGKVSDDTLQIDPDATVSYPRLGQLVTTLAANGQTITVNSPITGVVYNHQAQTTVWSSDWVDLDF